MTRLEVSAAKQLLLGAVVCVAAGCATAPPAETGTLASIDRPAATPPPAAEAARDLPRDSDTIKKAYLDYLATAEADDDARAVAARRVAELELTGASERSIEDEETALVASAARLEAALAQFPDAPDNDATLYQLAKIQDQLGRGDAAMAALSRLIRDYPATEHRAEAEFRLAEHAFVRADYDAAERGYSAVLAAPDALLFRDKALFKRGWARFKQDDYSRAATDFFAALGDAPPSADASPAEREEFAEQLRALALTFVYRGGAPALAAHFREQPAPSFEYALYEQVAALFEQRERYTDAAATLAGYVRENPTAPQRLSADLARIGLWRDADFDSRYREEFTELYPYYRPAGAYFGSPELTPAARTEAQSALREHVTRLAAHYHQRYRGGDQAALTTAEDWYKIYLADFSATAKQDGIYPLYGELLRTAQRPAQALTYYERAAFDGDTLLNKEAAYISLTLMQSLNKAERFLPRAGLYAKIYPAAPETVALVQSAVEIAFRTGQLESAVTLADQLPAQAPVATRLSVSELKAQALFDQGQFGRAERLLGDLMAANWVPAASLRSLQDRRALAVYRLGEAARSTGDDKAAAAEFLRAYEMAPAADFAANALYDGAGLLESSGELPGAVHYFERFKQQFPKHPLALDASKRLSGIYLRSGQNLAAAKEFEALAGSAGDSEERRAALWQAAELYRERGEDQSAARAYRQYADTYPRPFEPYVEALDALANLAQRQGDAKAYRQTLRALLAENQGAPAVATERTQYLAARAAFALAALRREEFAAIRLAGRLDRALAEKKAALQETVNLYGEAAQYGHREFLTESTFQIGRLYRDFAGSLLESERPRGLNPDELEQYNILLEDQAFPFEDKAIEFYETNLGRAPDSGLDPWVTQSLTELKALFPARYGRTGRVERFVEAL